MGEIMKTDNVVKKKEEYVFRAHPTFAYRCIAS